MAFYGRFEGTPLVVLKGDKENCCGTLKRNPHGYSFRVGGVPMGSKDSFIGIRKTWRVEPCFPKGVFGQPMLEGTH